VACYDETVVRRHAPSFQWVYLGFAAGAHAFAGFFLPLPRDAQGIDAFLSLLYYAALTGSAAAVLFEAISRKPKRYFAALTVHAVCDIALAPCLAGNLGIEVALFGALTVGLCLYNPFPLSSLFSALVNGIILLVRGFVLSSHGAGVRSVIEQELAYALIFAALTALASGIVLYREHLIGHRKENERLDGLVDRLTRANLNYQEYAQRVEEASIDGERKRITRDIHDIVGYTLTNNITMMEAITDMMNINPLGVSHLVKLARTNAQEGLTRVREALHLLRGREVEYPTGLRGIERLVRQFEVATGVRVESAFTEVQWNFPEELDSVLYHLVQESLVNSFRHGKASLIRMFLARREDAVEFKISDNGVGASEFREGIGLSGMRERLTRLGGSLSAGPVDGGFEVTATVKMETG
jgi:signal transduction histidine kinase